MQLYTPLRLTVAINVQAGEKCSRPACFAMSSVVTEIPVS